jgi:hypothetical protein
MTLRRTGIPADYLGGDSELRAPLRGRLRLDPERGLRFVADDGAVLAVATWQLEAAGVVERPAGGIPIAQKLRMMLKAGDWDTGRLRVVYRRGLDHVSLEFLVVSVDAGTEISRYNRRRERRRRMPLLALGPEDAPSADLAASQEVQDR